MLPLDIPVADTAEVILLSKMADPIQKGQVIAILVPVQITGIIQETMAVEVINLLLNHQDRTPLVQEEVPQE